MYRFPRVFLETFACFPRLILSDLEKLPGNLCLCLVYLSNPVVLGELPDSWSLCLVSLSNLLVLEKLSGYWSNPVVQGKLPCSLYVYLIYPSNLVIYENSLAIGACAWFLRVILLF
jgi:hypothetical protein